MKSILSNSFLLFSIFVLFITSCRFDSFYSNERNQKKLIKQHPIPTSVFNQHIALTASGENPTKWTLSMSFDHSFIIEVNEHSKIISSPTYPIIKDHSLVERYEINQGGETAFIALGAPSQRNQGSRIVDMKIGNTLYTGIGYYSFNYQLHDNWILQKISRDSIQPQNNSHNFPAISFNLKKHTFHGYNGHYTFKGDFDIRGNVLTFKFYMPKKKNSSMKSPMLLDQIIGNNACEYMINKNILTLILPDESRLFFKKKN